MKKIDSAEPAEQKNKLVSPYVSLESLLNYLLNDLKKYWSTKNDTEPQILILIFSPLRKPSQKNEIKKEKYEKEKTEFKKEIKVLKYIIKKRQEQKIHSPANKTQIQKTWIWPLQLLEAKMRQFNF